MSLGDLARSSGLSKQTLSKIEKGDGNPTVETLALLGPALYVPARRFLTEWGTARGWKETGRATGTGWRMCTNAAGAPPPPCSPRDRTTNGEP